MSSQLPALIGQIDGDQRIVWKFGDGIARQHGREGCVYSHSPHDKLGRQFLDYDLLTEQIDAPVNRRFIDTIVDSANLCFNGLVTRQYLLAGSVMF